ncbi:M48 family metalloprotease [Chachezhania antarctica]|uniref:M48 family metalloprotease n=1 Tax=Chachezhania antarctica TaxID=2340860 RepID=UPI001F0901E1|nr:M48 family metalloprotease [Chachezhania antarctica]
MLNIRPFRLPTIPPLHGKVNVLSALATRGVAVALVIVALMAATPARALTILRDAGIEYGLTQLSAPILRAAGLNPNRVKVLVIDDSSFNAFVVDRSTIFVHSGLIEKAGDGSVLQAVIAHEAAHITNGHITRRGVNMRSAQTVAGLGIALGIIAGVAGAGEAAGGLAIGVQNSALRSFLSHTRAEESAADSSAANYLQSAGLGAQGLVALHETFRGQEVLSAGRQDPYTRSHPLTRDRMRAAQAYVAANGAGAGPSDADRYWFARVDGVLTAFSRSPDWTLRRAAEEPWPDIRAMREAIAYHRNRDLSNSVAAIDRAIALRPDDPFYRDLKGQFLIESRQWQPALAAYGEAVNLAPDDALILGNYGRALLAVDRYKDAQQAMEKSLQRDARNARVLRALSLAYAETGQTGMAALVTAERFALAGRLEDAELHASRAIALLPRGSAGARRAEDIVDAAKQDKKRKSR